MSEPAQPAEPTATSPQPARQRNWFDTRSAAEQRSLFGEVLDWMFAPLLLLWPLSIAFTFFVARTLADAPYDRALADHANVIAQQVRFVNGQPTVHSVSALRTLIGVGTEETLFFRVSAADGRLLAGDPELQLPALYDFPSPGRTKLRNEIFRGQEVRIAYTYAQPREDDPSALTAPALVQVAETIDSRSKLANEIIKGVIFPQFVMLPLAVALVWFGLSRGLAPLKVLRQRIRDRRTDDLSPLDSRGMPEELSPLLESFNELLVRLDASLGAQKRFIADAAHQMKTPLAGLRTQAELALRETDPQEQHRRLRQLAIGSERTAHLVNQLLSLARTENVRSNGPGERLDLTPLTREIVGEWVAQAIRRGIDLGYENEAGAMPVLGHEFLLREMFANLIDNALRYTPRSGSVTVRLQRKNGRVCVEIEDSGPGIAPAERELVFERFYRVLGSNIDGSGLGLSIVREIALQHGAEVRISDGQGPDGPLGTCLSVIFPPGGAQAAEVESTAQAPDANTRPQREHQASL
jgi:two-component system sensor histidine kinase TctE